MSISKPKPEFDTGTCITTPAAAIALAAHRISPSEVFDAHRSLRPSSAMNSIEESERFLGLFGRGPITSFFHVPAAVFWQEPAVDLRVETSADRKTTKLRLKSEA